MTIKLIDPITDPRWDKFVENHPFGWICHLSGWKQVLEKSFKHMKGYYFALLDNSGNIQAALPIFEVKSWLTGNRLVSIPFATLCDPLISTGDDLKELFDSALNLSKDLKSSYIEIRAFLSPSLIQDDRLSSIHFYKHHYLLLEEEPEKLKKKFHRTCVRQRITRAEKSDLKVKLCEKEVDLDKFYSLHLITRKRLGLPSQPYRFFKNLWDEFTPTKRLTLLLAEKNGGTIGGLILLKFKDRVSVDFAASDDKFTSMSPNHLLFWEAIRLAYEEGYRIFDFGRTSPNNKNLMDFKRRWGTQVIDLPLFYYPKMVAGEMGQQEETWKYKLMSKVCKDAPSSVQKIIGNFCYRHLG